ncbi:MAG: cysteine hydrolase [Kiloniellales bacterium]|nr:cysteine hydrolase [Kiloniellales bacterium]
MTDPHTLRDIAGLGAEPNRIADSALVLIDCQNTYREGVMQLVGVEPALDQAAKLLARFRAAKRPVVHIQHDSGPGSPYDIRAEIGAIAAPVAPEGDEPVVVKGRPNSFVGTDLHERLQSLGVENLILAGFMTHMCVNSTARGAFNHGYRSTVVAGATATRDLPRPDGGVIKAADLHHASLAGMADLFTVVVGGVEALPD